MKRSDIFTKKLETAQQAIGQFFGKIVNITQLKGLSNFNNLVEYIDRKTGEERKLVLKILNLNSITKTSDNPKLLNLLNQLNITPKILLNQFPYYYIIDYLAGVHPTTQVLNQEKVAQNFRNLIYKIHDLEKLPDVRFISFINSAHGLLADIISKNKDAVHLKELLTDTALEFDKFPQTLSFCHNDINLENIILTPDNTIKFIDFEYAGISDVFFDLASIKKMLYDNNYDKLLKKYSEDLSQKFPERVFYQKLEVVSKLGWITEATWYLYMSYNDTVKNQSLYKDIFNKLYSKLK